MSVLSQQVKFAGSKGSINLETLFDSGASYSFIKKSIAEKLGLLDNLHEPMKFETAKENEGIWIKQAIRLAFIINDIKLSDEFLIAEDLTEEVIIGAATLQKWHIKLDFEFDKVIVDKKASRLILK